MLLSLVRELADYEQAAEAVQATEKQLHDALFGSAPVARCHVAQAADELVGMAVWYPTFSTWTGRPGIWLEDLYVRPAARRGGHGRLLLQALAALCRENDYTRLEWWVLDWNVSAQGFYTSLGAVAQDEWSVWRVDGVALDALAPPSTP